MIEVSTLACATCQLNSAGHGDSAGYAILFMLAVILPILGGVVFCMARIARREGAELDPELRDDFDSAEFARRSQA